MSFLKPQVGKVFLKKTTGGQSVISPFIYIYIYIWSNKTTRENVNCNGRMYGHEGFLNQALQGIFFLEKLTHTHTRKF